jgi:hypothetical protein
MYYNALPSVTYVTPLQLLESDTVAFPFVYA